MILRYFSIALILMTVFSCDSRLKINIDIENTPDQKVSLEHFYKDSFILLGEQDIGSSSFSFKTEPVYPELLRLRYGLGKYILLSIDKGDKNVKVSGDWNDFDRLNYVGSASTEDLQRFMSEMRKFASEQNAYEKVKSHLQSQNDKDSLYKDAVQKSIDSRIDFELKVEDYINNSPYLLNKLFVMRFLKKSVKQSFIDSTLKALLDKYPDNEELAYTAHSISSIKTAVQSAEKDMAPEIVSTTPEGKTLKLSDLRGKYVLVDFWASWCPPCRAVNPDLVEFYHKYKGENFTILGVSLDKKKEKWLQAIEADKLDWHHVSDLNGWQGVYVRDFGFNAIPYNVLVSPEGKILSRNLSVSQLDVKLADINKSATQ